MPVTPELISFALSARDKIHQLLDNDSEELDDDAYIIISGFRGLYDASMDGEEEFSSHQTNDPRTPVTYRIRFKPSQDILQLEPILSRFFRN